jgi:putative Mn2+ efflux pump MntP
MATIRRWLDEVSFRIQTTETNLPFHLLCLVLGFFLGNLFGTFLAALRHFIPSDLAIIGLLCLVFEYISAQAYKRSSQTVQRTWRRSFGRGLNLVKIGSLFGFFVDAFKVGS